ncbi:bifunctional adenosylcobinamide kinase/adenosylcobinamide-phosphate guanylyltransferase [Echinicola marina]|uniref:bifunctional adenosylcobinamide kinase/adenosylcobinamide-phosphate guanylyltransferase n=1 Tax=Echinicola marina TaxID=2859768 RepID=UPI001CF704FD|nr:bifunctional adenosylcobinamide kinase/adenosylcobinamide-phosphate guanylyltransferase [Echinicola marina]UCS92835.1 bifunctional adenosylcobinamide kinase/adenosylcobinamide-phosphate guanylyltransferase [Echinicola marina]
MIYYITGGERSGKSRYAQELAEQLSESPYYLATSRIWDDDFKKRVDRHLADRDERWTTIEEEKYLSKVDISNKTIVMDCVTLWLTNWYADSKNDISYCLESCKKELEITFQNASDETNLIIISNEIGMGIHAQTAVARKFTELQGWINQFIAKNAHKATFMVSGLSIELK